MREGRGRRDAERRARERERAGGRGHPEGSPPESMSASRPSACATGRSSTTAPGRRRVSTRARRVTGRAGRPRRRAGTTLAGGGHRGSARASFASGGGTPRHDHLLQESVTQRHPRVSVRERRGGECGGSRRIQRTCAARTAAVEVEPLERASRHQGLVALWERRRRRGRQRRARGGAKRRSHRPGTTAGVEALARGGRRRRRRCERRGRHEVVVLDGRASRCASRRRQRPTVGPRVEVERGERDVRRRRQWAAPGDATGAGRRLRRVVGVGEHGGRCGRMA